MYTISMNNHRQFVPARRLKRQDNFIRKHRNDLSKILSDKQYDIGSIQRIQDALIDEALIMLGFDGHWIEKKK